MMGISYPCIWCNEAKVQWGPCPSHFRGTEYESYLELPTNPTPPDAVGRRKVQGGGGGQGWGEAPEFLQTTALMQCSRCSLGAAPHSTPIWRHYLFYSPFSHATQTQPQILINHPPLVSKPSPSPFAKELHFPPHHYPHPEDECP